MNQLEEHSIGLEEAHVGVNDVEIIQLLFKNMIYLYVDVVLEKLLLHWDLGKIIR
jgi:hypothetical protein|tara:strand:+ start:73 stop:237 length:165 start_codon:yes stop_codon:yes gene_type:complete